MTHPSLKGRARWIVVSLCSSSRRFPDWRVQRKCQLVTRRHRHSRALRPGPGYDAVTSREPSVVRLMCHGERDRRTTRRAQFAVPGVRIDGARANDARRATDAGRGHRGRARRQGRRALAGAPERDGRSRQRPGGARVQGRARFGTRRQRPAVGAGRHALGPGLERRASATGGPICSAIGSATAAPSRGTIHGAYMLDFDLDFQGCAPSAPPFAGTRSSSTRRKSTTSARGTTRRKTTGRSYSYDDFSSDFYASFEPVRYLHLGVTGGYFQRTHGPERRGRSSADRRALPGGPTCPGSSRTRITRASARSVLRFARLADRPAKRRTVRGPLPRVLGRRAEGVCLSAGGVRVPAVLPLLQPQPRRRGSRGRRCCRTRRATTTVPFYLQPTLGGNDDLRGFVAYRFRDDHSLSLGARAPLACVELAGHGALRRCRQSRAAQARRPCPRTCTTAAASVSAFRARSAIVNRIDFAGSREGFRIIWTFSDIFKPQL